MVTYGMREDAMVRATEIVPGDRMRFRALREGAAPLEITLNLPGRHNVQNALAAIAVATELGVPDAVIRKALAEFRYRRTANRRPVSLWWTTTDITRSRCRRRSTRRAALFRAGASCSPFNPTVIRAHAICSRTS